MIKMHNLVPSVYYNESRDFQFLGRSLETLFNYNKTGVDLMKGIPLSNNIDDKLVPLVSKTLGFESKHNYNINDLKALCSSFSHLLNNKGSLSSIEDAIHILLNSQHIDKQFTIEISSNDDYNLDIYIPAEVTDLILLEDVFNYILPVGFTYNFIYADFSSPLKTSLSISENVTTFKFNNSNLGLVAKPKESDIRPENNSSKLGLTYTGIVIGGNKNEN